MEPLGETRVTGEPRRRVSYYFDPDIGTYAYTMQVKSLRACADSSTSVMLMQSRNHRVHPMKPHRIKMAHNLIVNYGLDKKMEVLVCQCCT